MPTSRPTGTSPDAEVLREIYAQLTTYLGALRVARGAARGTDVQALLDDLTDEALASERKVLEATRTAAGTTMQDAY